MALAILWLGLGLRAPLVWSAAPLDVDESLYASYARHISHENDGWLANVAVDKPPLAFYLTAASFKLFGPSDWAARLPDLFASVLSLAVLVRLARGLYRSPRVALLAMLCLALCPFDIAFAGTVFLDPLTTLWILLACLWVVEGRWGWSGLGLGLAFATKPSALFALPLILALGLIAPRGSPTAGPVRGLAHLLATAAAIVVLALGWGLVGRPPGMPHWWMLNTAHNTPGRLIHADEVVPRLEYWLSILAQAFSGIVPAVGLGLLAAGGLAWRVRQEATRRATAIDLVLAAYVLGSLALYWLVAFNLYERYLHLLIPLGCLLIGRGLERIARFAPQRRIALAHGLIAALLILGLGPSALAAQAGATLLSPNQARYAGIVEAASYLNRLPPGTIVYDHWLGWSLAWYTGLNRPADMWLRFTYYTTPEALAANSAQQPDPAPRYFIAPDWVWAGPWIAALNANGPPVQQAARFEHIVIYRFDPAETAD